MEFFSPAKVNLFLQILSKREDGYHELYSLFQTVDFGDEITVKKSAQDVFTCTVKHLETRDNLVWKALHLFRRATGCLSFFDITLKKQIPEKMGLGGGSSNAATTLYALNHLTGSPLTVLELMRLGVELGADVPFFFSRGSALCEGIGEKITPVTIPKQKLFLLFPKESLETKLVYSYLRSYSVQDPSLLFSWKRGNIALSNDLEAPAFSLKKNLEIFKQRLLTTGFSSVSMTGSGAGFFALSPGKFFCEYKEASFLQRKESSWYEK